MLSKNSKEGFLYRKGLFFDIYLRIYYRKHERKALKKNNKARLLTIIILYSITTYPITIHCFNWNYLLWRINNYISENSDLIHFVFGVISTYSLFKMLTRNPVTNIIGGSSSIYPVKPENNWKDYVGVPQRVKQLSDQIKNSEQYVKMGVPIPNGFLFHGDTGTGKTALARWLAADLDCPFFAFKGSDFSLSFVGAGTQKLQMVYNTLEQYAKKSTHKTAILFIDEIDVITKDRSSRKNFTNDGDPVVNELLAKLDGFSSNKAYNIIVIGTTNLIKDVDTALMRSGRFESIQINNPSYRCRMLRIAELLKQKPSNKNISATILARLTNNCNYADINEIFNVAGSLAISHYKQERDPLCFALALLQVKFGNRLLSDKDRINLIEERLFAYNITHLDSKMILPFTKGLSKQNIHNMFFSANYSSLNNGLLHSLQISAKNIQNEIENKNKQDVIKMCEKLFNISYDELDNKKKVCNNKIASNVAVIGEKRLSCNKQCKKIIYSFEENNQLQIRSEIIREKIRLSQYPLLLIE